MNCYQPDILRAACGQVVYTLSPPNRQLELDGQKRKMGVLSGPSFAGSLECRLPNEAFPCQCLINCPCRGNSTLISGRFQCMIYREAGWFEEPFCWHLRLVNRAFRFQ